MIHFLWFLSLMGSIAGGFMLLVAISASNGAPQQAAGAAIALGLAVIPYVFTRCIEGSDTANWRKQMLAEAKKLAAEDKA